MRILSAILFVFLLAFLTDANAGENSSCRRPGRFATYVLAMTWQPGFCEHKSGNRDKPECRDLMSGKLRIDHLTLHVLWPNNPSCGASYAYCPGPRLQLQPQTIASIQPWMPNWYYSSRFGAYQWQKHGTCQTGLDDDRYFRKAVDAVQTFNNSLAGQYLVKNQGRSISKKVLFAQLNHEVGDERAADNLTLLCQGDNLYEIRLLLPRDFTSGQGIAALLNGALDKRAKRSRDECRNDRLWIEQSGRE